jgi:hypothetical protein
MRGDKARVTVLDCPCDCLCDSSRDLLRDCLRHGAGGMGIKPRSRVVTALAGLLQYSSNRFGTWTLKIRMILQVSVQGTFALTVASAVVGPGPLPGHKSSGLGLSPGLLSF